MAKMAEACCPDPSVPTLMVVVVGGLLWLEAALVVLTQLDGPHRCMWAGECKWFLIDRLDIFPGVNLRSFFSVPHVFR